MGAGELPVEARLADAGLADDGHDLPVSVHRPGVGEVQLIHLGVAADESGQRAGRVQSGAGGLRPDDLVHLHRPAQALHRQGAERVHLDVALHQLSVCAVIRIDSGVAICSMRAARCVVCPTAV